MRDEKPRGESSLKQLWNQEAHSCFAGSRDWGAPEAVTESSACEEPEREPLHKPHLGSQELSPGTAGFGQVPPILSCIMPGSWGATPPACGMGRQGTRHVEKPQR